MKTKYYIKDKVDGQEHCLSGDTQFYLIDATEEVEHLLSTQRSEILSEIKGMIKVQTDLYDLTGSDVIKNEALEDVLNKLR